jgi:GDPmannose 4,6-dehydratase
MGCSIQNLLNRGLEHILDKKALILGIGGQDGYYLTELLFGKGYQILGVLRPEDLSEETLGGLKGKATLLQGDIRDGVLMARVLDEIRPDEIYNLAGISFIPLSWQKPALVGEVNGSAVGCILELIRTNLPAARFFQAGSSEMFGHDPAESPQNEDTIFKPDNPYASAKVFAVHLVANYRKHFDLFACTGTLYNHESPKRAKQFVTRKIARAAVAIRLGLQNELVLGDLKAARDWSYAGDTVKAMWLMLQQDEPKDFIIGSGKLHTIQDCLDVAFSYVGLNWQDYVRTDPRYVRPLETRPLLADPTWANEILGWQPQVDFEELIEMMVKADLKSLQ